MINKNNFYTVLFYFATLCNLLAQDSDIKAIYGIQPLRDLEAMENGEAKNIMERVVTVLADFEFELLANGNESLFRKRQQLKTDEVPEYIHNIALAFSQGDKIWYTNGLTKTKIAATNDYGEPITLILDEKLNWELTNENKKLGNFLAYKATASRTKGSTTDLIIAWFTNDLPYNNGPLAVDGLPGLIVELQTQEIIFSLKSVEKVKQKIKNPSKGKTMSFKEYYERLDKEMEGIMKTEQ